MQRKRWDTNNFSKLTWHEPAINRKQHLVRGQLQKTRDLDVFVVDLSPRYGHMILVSTYQLIITWMSNIKEVYTVNQGWDLLNAGGILFLFASLSCPFVFFSSLQCRVASLGTFGIRFLSVGGLFGGWPSSCAAPASSSPPSSPSCVCAHEHYR